MGFLDYFFLPVETYNTELLKFKRVWNLTLENVLILGKKYTKM